MSFVFLGVGELVVGKWAGRGPHRGQPVVAAVIELETNERDRLAA